MSHSLNTCVQKCWNDYVRHMAPFQTATNSARFQPPSVNDKHNEQWIHTLANLPFTQKRKSQTEKEMKTHGQGLLVHKANTWTRTFSHLNMHSGFLTVHNTVLFLTGNFKMTDSFLFLFTEYFLAQRLWHACTHDINVHSPGRIYKASDIIHDMQ